MKWLVGFTDGVVFPPRSGEAFPISAVCLFNVDVRARADIVIWGVLENWAVFPK